MRQWSGVGLSAFYETQGLLTALPSVLSSHLSVYSSLPICKLTIISSPAERIPTIHICFHTNLHHGTILARAVKVRWALLTPNFYHD